MTKLLRQEWVAAQTIYNVFLRTRSQMLDSITEDKCMTWKISIKTHTGKIVDLCLFSLATAKSIKGRITHAVAIPPDQIRMFFRGIRMRDSKTMDYYGVSDGSTLDMVCERTEYQESVEPLKYCSDG